MPDNSNAKKEEDSQSSKNIQIPKQTAGAVAGAAAGSIAGPIGAVVGGVVGAVAGKAAEKQRPMAPAARRTVRRVMKSSKAISKAPRRRRPSKKSVAKPLVHGPAASQKRRYRVDQGQQNHAKDRELADDRNRRGLLGNALALAANDVNLGQRAIRGRRTRKLIPYFGRPLKGTYCLRSKFFQSNTVLVPGQ
jgi:hypothetical protein